MSHPERRYSLGTLVPALVAGALLTVAVAAPALADPKPSQDELRRIWEGGIWSQNYAHGGGALSSSKDGEEPKYDKSIDYLSPTYEPPNPVPLKPEAKKRELEIRAALKAGHSIFAPYSQCHPPGMPYVLTMDGYGGWDVRVGASELLFLYPNDDYRQIFIDGRPHVDPAKVEPTYNGDSVAHWEGDTMVVDTTNIRGSNTQIEPYIPKAEGSHTVERFTPVSPGVIAYQMTMENPDFTRPWVVKMTLHKGPKGHMIQGLCTDENRYVMTPGSGLTMHGPDGKPLEKAED